MAKTESVTYEGKKYDLTIEFGKSMKKVDVKMDAGKGLTFTFIIDVKKKKPSKTLKEFAIGQCASQTSSSEKECYGVINKLDAIEKNVKMIYLSGSSIEPVISAFNSKVAPILSKESPDVKDWTISLPMIIKIEHKGTESLIGYDDAMKSLKISKSRKDERNMIP